MKVCFVSHSSGKWGAERAMLELIDALISKGVKVFVLLPSYGPLCVELRGRGIRFEVLPYEWWMDRENFPIRRRIKRFFLSLLMVIPIAVKIKQWGCDIIYTNTITIPVGALAAKLFGLPHVWHIHEFGYEDHGLVFALGSKISLWLMDRLSTICIANSHAVAQKYRQYIKPSKVRVIYYSVNIPPKVSAEKPVTPNVGIRCVIVGALQEGKRQEDAIQAVGELLRNGIKATLYIVGDGDPKYREYLYSLVTENGLSDYICFMGYIENPLPFMQNADVVLMCSRYEAFGRVTVEAMKLGEPVIGARSGGTTELIRDGFNGLLYAPGDYRELAEKIRYLYEHPDIALQMGENARQWARESFTQDRYGNEVLSILEQLLEDKVNWRQKS